MMLMGKPVLAVVGALYLRAAVYDVLQGRTAQAIVWALYGLATLVLAVGRK